MLGATASPYMQHQRPRLSLIIIAVFWLLVGGNLSGTGLNASATILVALSALFALPCVMVYKTGRDNHGLERLNPERARVPATLWAFALCALLSAVAQQTEAGTQNALIYLSFVALMALTATWTSANSPMTVLRWMRAAAAVGAVGYLATVAIRGPGSDGMYAARTYGEIVWIGMAVAVPIASWSRVGYVVPLLLLAASLLSLSRTASAVCAIQFIALASKGRGRREFLKLILLASVTAYGTYLTFTRFQPLRDRFIDNDNEVIGGVVTGTSGRSRTWSITWESIKESPWTGHGIGSAQQTITDALGPNSVSHPLNDYLRIWHDLGVIGLVLWVSTILILSWGAFHRWRTANHDADRAVHQAALLALIGLSINAITSNPVVYIFVLAPVAVIIGTSLGRANAVEPRLADGTPRGHLLDLR